MDQATTDHRFGPLEETFTRPSVRVADQVAAEHGFRALRGASDRPLVHVADHVPWRATSRNVLRPAVLAASKGPG